VLPPKNSLLFKIFSPLVWVYQREKCDRNRRGDSGAWFSGEQLRLGQKTTKSNSYYVGSGMSGSEEERHGFAGPVTSAFLDPERTCCPGRTER